MVHYQPLKFRRRGDNHTRIVMFNPPVVTHPSVHGGVAGELLQKVAATLLSLFL